MFNRRVVYTAILLSLLTTLIPQGSFAQQAALETSEVRVGILPIAAHAPIFAAQELGYFESEGLKVATEFSVGGAALLPLVIQGQMQIANIPVSTGLLARAQNLDVVMIGPGTYTGKVKSPGDTALVVKADSGITRPADLSGKKIAVNVINSVNWLYAAALLEKYGVDPKSVSFVELPFPNMVDAVVAGHVDVAVVTQPFLHFGAAGGKVRPIAYHFEEVQPGVEISGFAVSRKWATGNPRTLAAFERAVSRAVDYLMGSEERAIPILAQFTKMKPEVIRKTGVPSWTNELSRTNMTEQMRLMIRHGLLEKAQDVGKLIWSSTHR